ncbi:hypothetical protein OG978_32495 [Streptomyces sp. NBC_01591]|uniref:hypothetical protein n=1 Tax=Streptomyces sp. NBC_01591 TaxID=2975888 RepID=UPI002DDA1102|nr:hypothetical protein [Streptomyces sp. NBC_01591]WSD71694.1 hypothetical protein OG978_32495 [Streptomyces sp. NBC_01591]
MTSTTICAEYSTHTDHPPVGPCVLRPGHRGHIHQDVRGMQWSGRPGACPNSPTGEHRYDEGDGRPESRTCDHCGAGGCCVPGAPAEYCGALSSPIFDTAPAECVLRPGHSGSHADNHGGRWRYITDESAAGSDSDDELRARLHAAIRAIGCGEQEIAELRQRTENAEMRLQHVREVLLEDGYFTADEIGPDLAPRLGEWLIHHQGRTDQAEATATRVRDALHRWRQHTLMPQTMRVLNDILVALEERQEHP